MFGPVITAIDPRGRSASFGTNDSARARRPGGGPFDLDAGVRIGSGFVDDLRADVVVLDGDGRQRAERVDLGDRVREPLYPFRLAPDALAHVDDEQQLVLQGVRALRGDDDLPRALLQFVRVALAVVLQRLSAAVVVGDAVEVGVGHLDVVAVDLIVADRQRVDPGALALARLQVCDPLAPRARVARRASRSSSNPSPITPPR